MKFTILFHYDRRNWQCIALGSIAHLTISSSFEKESWQSDQKIK
ncbi:hypothetical protein [Candidatus Methylacidiphilum fumarolicum]|nr:hypothetical protein [Candidatus Methylacidiphilum fumarolicum]